MANGSPAARPHGNRQTETGAKVVFRKKRYGDLGRRAGTGARGDGEATPPANPSPAGRLRASPALCRFDCLSAERAKNQDEGVNRAMKWLRDTITGKDNLTYEAVRLVGVTGAGAYVVFWFAAVFNLGHFSATDAAAYGGGLATVLLAMSGAVRIKEAPEPEAPQGKVTGDRPGE